MSGGGNIKGQVLVNTGDGKGKTTAALGLAIRHAGWDGLCSVVQFLKDEAVETGEKKIFARLGIEMAQAGIGFSWTKSVPEQRAAIQSAWDLALEKLKNPAYSLVILDEILYVFSIDRFPIEDILSVKCLLAALAARPPEQHVVLTGRNAPQEIIQYADLVTRMECVKHYYANGLGAVKGLDY